MMINEDETICNFSMTVKGNMMARKYRNILKCSLAYLEWMPIKMNVLYEETSVVKLSDGSFIVNYDVKLR